MNAIFNYLKKLNEARPIKVKVGDEIQYLFLGDTLCVRNSIIDGDWVLVDYTKDTATFEDDHCNR